MIIKHQPFLKRNFISYDYAVVDTTATSDNYFKVTYLPSTIGGGKSLIKFQGNGQNLELNSQTEIEILDAAGNPVKTDITTYIDRFNNYYVTISVYDNTAPGVGTVCFVGKATRDLKNRPIQSNNTNELGYNVVWTASINIQPTERNNSPLVFNEPPSVDLAQVITPLRINNSQITSQQFAIVTCSIATITTSNFKGFDQKAANSKNILSSRLQSIQINPNQQSTTTNTVNTDTKSSHPDIIGGYAVNEVNEYNTVITTTTPFFSSSYVGGYLEFFNQRYTLSPQTQSNTTIANTNPYNTLTNTAPTVQDQLNYWKSTIVKVDDSRTAYLDTPVAINTTTTNGTRTSTNTHTYKSVSRFTASLYYTPSSEVYVTSSAISQSYLQFTFNELDPIAGDVYKVRLFYKRSSVNQDWTIINDQIITAPEYLTDARYPNQTSYARRVSDYLLQGHFTSQQIVNNNWSLYNETLTGFDTATASYDSTTLIDSIKLETKNDPSGYYRLLTTKYYQNYAEEQAFTIDFNCTLGPYTELELYASSDALSTTLISTDYQSRAYNKSKNNDKTRFSENYTRFGKYIGKVVNNSQNTVHYGRVAFDFESDREGLGRPLFRCKPVSTVTGSAWIAQVGVKPIKYNGFTPQIVQFAIPTPSDYSSLLSESVDYKIEYFNYTGEQSEFVTYLNNIPLNLVGTVPTNGCQAESRVFTFTPTYYASASATIPNALIAIKATSQITQSVSTSTRFYAAFTNGAVGTLGSYAGQFAEETPVDGWNCAIPYIYMSSSTVGAPGNYVYISASISNTDQIVYRNAAGRVTSSWRWFDTFTKDFTTGPGLSTALSTWGYLTSSTSVVDNAYFTTHSSVGIRRSEASQSYADYVNATTNTQRTVALKRRRLVYPTGGSLTSSLFTENGGIYNVKFKLKRDPSSTTTYTPQSGSYLMVYIFDAYKDFTEATRGKSGWYPPDRNIVKIGHAYTSGSVTTPALTWLDSATGQYYDEYDINVIQYGTPAQLVFEPSGDGGAYFGTLIDDVQFCKIGSTTDPNFIKPTSLANIYAVSSNSSNNVPQR